MTLPVDFDVLLIAWTVTCMATVVQRSIGIGFSIVSVPTLYALDPVLAPVPQILVVMPLTVSMLWAERRHVDTRGFGWLLLGRFPGAAIGVLLLKIADQNTLSVIIGVTVLLAVVVIASGVTIPHNRLTKFTAGVVSGVSALVASIGGPPLALLYRNQTGPAIRSTLAAIFTIGLVITISARALSGEILRAEITVAALLFPAVILGVVLGRHLAPKVEGPLLKNSILLLSVIAASALLLRQ